MLRIRIAVRVLRKIALLGDKAALLGAGVQAQGDFGLVALDLWRKRS